MLGQWRDIARAGLVLLSAAVLLGVDCPHHGATPDAEHASSKSAAPSCHQHPQPVEPAPLDADPALDCGCLSCDVATGVAPATSGPVAAPAIAFVAPAVPPAPRITPRPRGDWTPPPYPGFSENTVVLLN